MRLSLLLPIVSLLGLSLASPVPGAREKLAERETPLNAFLTVLLDYLPALDASIESLVGVLTAFEELLALVTGEQTTYNDLTGSCKTYTVVFARGTTEPGNVGILVGPPFFDALRTKLGSSAIAVQGVNDYNADIDGYLAGGDAGGSKEMAVQIEAAYAKCPNTKLVASGYSQGGQIVHNAAALLPAAVASWISSVVIFGDPDDGTPIANVAASKVHTVCHTGDDICVNGDLILPAHLTYAEDATTAAAFVAAQ